MSQTVLERRQIRERYESASAVLDEVLGTGRRLSDRERLWDRGRRDVWLYLSHDTVSEGDLTQYDLRVVLSGNVVPGGNWLHKLAWEDPDLDFVRAVAEAIRDNDDWWPVVVEWMRERLLD